MDDPIMAHKLFNTVMLLGGGFVVCYALAWCAYGVGWCLARLLGYGPDKNSIDRPGKHYPGPSPFPSLHRKSPPLIRREPLARLAVRLPGRAEDVEDAGA